MREPSDAISEANNMTSDAAFAVRVAVRAATGIGLSVRLP